MLNSVPNKWPNVLRWVPDSLEYAGGQLGSSYRDWITTSFQRSLLDYLKIGILFI